MQDPEEPYTPYLDLQPDIEGCPHTPAHHIQAGVTQLDGPRSISNHRQAAAAAAAAADAHTAAADVGGAAAAAYGPGGFGGDVVSVAAPSCTGRVGFRVQLLGGRAVGFRARQFGGGGASLCVFSVHTLPTHGMVLTHQPTPCA